MRLLGHSSIAPAEHGVGLVPALSAPGMDEGVPERVRSHGPSPRPTNTQTRVWVTDPGTELAVERLGRLPSEGDRTLPAALAEDSVDGKSGWQRAVSFGRKTAQALDG